LYPKTKNSKHSRSCLVIFGIAAIGLPALLLCGGALALIGRDRAARAELVAKKEAIRQQGLPADNESLKAFVEKNTSLKFSEDWLNAMRIVETPEFGESIAGLSVLDDAPEVPLPGQTSSLSDGQTDSDPSNGVDSAEEPAWDEQRNRGYLQQESALLDRLEELAIMQLDEELPVRFARDYVSFNTLLPEVQSMRNLARLMLLRGQVALYDRDSEQTSKSIQSMLGMSEVIGGEPFLIAQLVRLAIRGMGLGLLKDALQCDVLDESDLKQLLPLVLARSEIGDSWKLSLYGERAMTMEALSSPDGLQKNSTVNPATRVLPIWNSSGLRYLESMDNAIGVPLDDLDQFRSVIQKLDAQMQLAMAAPGLAQLENAVMGVLAMRYSQVADSFVAEALKNRLAALAIGVRLAEKRDGQIPASLVELVENEPLLPKLDELRPIGGKPFGYQVDESGAVLWGFPLQISEETPDEPPDPKVDDGNAEIWRWDLPSPGTGEPRTTRN
jgi:hypothetical protein